MVATDISLDTLGRALDQTGELIGGLRLDQASQPTPCPDWDVRQLVNHIVFDVQAFTAMVSGGQRGQPGSDLIGDDWSAAYHMSAAGLMDAWRQRGIDGTLQTPMGELPLTWAVGQHIADLAVHAWDLARASGRSPDELDPVVGQTALAWGRQNLKPEYRGQAFGPPIEVPETAPVYDQLAGFFGRSPG